LPEILTQVATIDNI